MKLSEVPTKILIRELSRRKRLIIVDANQLYYNEQRHDEKYLQHLEYQLAQEIGHVLLRRDLIEFKDRAHGQAQRRQRGSIAVVISQKVSNALAEEGLRGLSATPGGVPSDDAADPSVTTKKSLDAAR